MMKTKLLKLSSLCLVAVIDLNSCSAYGKVNDAVDNFTSNPFAAALSAVTGGKRLLPEVFK
ncbi:lipoprotein LipA [Kingella kingae]|uniref:hypothetical protein n=1 Tax=Kingella kingae TaxID=504 RepID=UPI00050A1C5E|nr:hypothetical protein [Kingella kingae]MDK4527328.1 lipoprotein LipA [Kingella kingae]MDK4533416.1 lipoprotein LipA [Kingella kingae]